MSSNTPEVLSSKLEKRREYSREYYRARAHDPEFLEQQRQRKKTEALNPEVKRKKLAAKRRRDGKPEPTRPETDTCECCGVTLLSRKLDLDHCHTTGVFRGWLCGQCNKAIGLLGDSLTGVEKAMSYLRRVYV